MIAILTLGALRFLHPMIAILTLGASVSLVSLGSLAVLDGATPRLVDEWQSAPRVWDMVRRESDHRGSPGQFILTGYTDPPADIKQHSRGETRGSCGHTSDAAARIGDVQR